MGITSAVTLAKSTVWLGSAETVTLISMNALGASVVPESVAVTA